MSYFRGLMVEATLTVRQEEVLGFVREFIEEKGYPPTLRDICGRLRINGPANARKHLDALERKGFIKRSSNISRAIEVIGNTDRAGTAMVPIVGRVRAGGVHLAIEDISGHVGLDAGFFRCKGAFLLRVEGESMTGAGIDEGDLVLVRPQKEAADNEIVVAMIDGEATVKRFIMEAGAVILKPENPAFAPIVVSGEERDFMIVGKVISVIKSLEK